MYDVDYAYLREYNYLLGKIGGNLNQITKRINETRSIYQTNMDAVIAEMDRFWKVQNVMLICRSLPIILVEMIARHICELDIDSFLLPDER